MNEFAAAPEPLAGAGTLPELAHVSWRPLLDRSALVRRGRLWTLTTLAHSLPFFGTAILLTLLKPITLPVGLVLVAHGIVIPELYAARGANVLLPRRRGDARSERTALGLLGDLVDHPARELHARAGLVLERGALGIWLLGQSGAVLVAPGGRRVFCWCVRAPDPDLPSADRIAHLLLALREDEAGFATVANLAFSGSTPRLRRRLRRAVHPALDEARQAARRIVE